MQKQMYNLVILIKQKSIEKKEKNFFQSLIDNVLGMIAKFIDDILEKILNLVEDML